MHEKTSNEFHMSEGDRFLFAGFVIICHKGYMRISHGGNTRVANGNAVSVSSKIINGIAKTIEGFFNIRNPGFMIKVVSKLRPCI